MQIWERGRREHPVDRALTILAVLSERPRRELAEMSLERRDSELLAWRARLFGDAIVGYSDCPGCGCAVDVSLRVDGVEVPDDRFVVPVAGRELVVRMPTSLDLAAVANCESVAEARLALVRRCVEGAPGPGGGANGERGSGQPGPAPDEGLVAIVEAELDRRAGISGGTVQVVCPECGHEWPLELDVGAFAWREIEILASRLLHDVDTLARRYGWSEQEILHLSPDRRRFYLELAS